MNERTELLGDLKKREGVRSRTVVQMGFVVRNLNVGRHRQSNHEDDDPFSYVPRSLFLVLL
jgi:hypothetical protein